MPRESFLANILREFVIEICFDEFKKIELERLPCSHCSQHCATYVNKHGHDIYGQKIENHDANGQFIICGVCKKSVAIVRFAPHLEKCMGVGRTGRCKRARTKTAPAGSEGKKDVSGDDGHITACVDDKELSGPNNQSSSQQKTSSQQTKKRKSSNAGLKDTGTDTSKSNANQTNTANSAVSLLGLQLAANGDNLMDELNLS